MAIDSSGIKAGNRGEWRRTGRRSKGHGWVKLHVLVDVKTKQVLSFKITDENVHDSEMLIPVMKQLENNVGPGKVESTLGDRGYDSHKNFNYMERRRVRPGIKPRVNASIEKKTTRIKKKHCSDNTRRRVRELEKRGEVRAEMDG